MAQIQCPNCGGYKVGSTKGAGCDLLMLLLGVVTFGITWVILFFKELNRTIKAGEYVSCDLCGHAWFYDPKQRYVKPNQDLILKGEERLRREAQQRAAAFHYSQKKKK